MTTQVRMAAVAVGLIACSTPRASAEVLVEAEGYRFKVGSIGSSPTGAGADVDNSLHLEGFGPAVRLGASLGSTRGLELRWRRLEADYTYATALPYLVLNGEQQVGLSTVDVLLAQKLGQSPLHLELGYRHLGLDRFWHDDQGLGYGGSASESPAIQSFELNSQLSGHGVRGAIVLDAHLVGPLRVGATLGLGVLRAHQSAWLDRPADGGVVGAQRVVLAPTTTMAMPEGSIRLLVEVKATLWLAIGYRFEALYEPSDDDYTSFDAHGPTIAVGFRFGGHR